MIREGYNEERQTACAMQKQRERPGLASWKTGKKKTGIKNLKVKFNKVFGYYFEVTNSFKDMVPDYFVRKQTLTNAERLLQMS